MTQIELRRLQEIIHEWQGVAVLIYLAIYEANSSRTFFGLHARFWVWGQLGGEGVGATLAQSRATRAQSPATLAQSQNLCVDRFFTHAFGVARTFFPSRTLSTAFCRPWPSPQAAAWEVEGCGECTMGMLGFKGAGQVNIHEHQRVWDC